MSRLILALIFNDSKIISKVIPKLSWFFTKPHMNMFNPPNLNEEAFFELKTTNCYLKVAFSLSGISN